MSTTPRTDAAWVASFSPERANFSVRDECEKLETELAGLRAELSKIYSLVAPHGCDLPNGIRGTAQAVSDLIARAERAEAECLEQARLLGMSGEREADLLGKLERLHSINENILFFAFRYALGRRSTAPGIVADVLINRWNDLKPHTQIQVQREIGSAMAMGEAGSSCDLDTWQKVLALPVKPWCFAPTLSLVPKPCSFPLWGLG